MTSVPGFIAHTIYRIAPDDVAAFRSLALRMAAMAKARDGCLSLDVAQDAGDPATFHLIEGWRDQAAMDDHAASEAFQSVVAEAVTLQVLGRSIRIFGVATFKEL